MDHRRTKKRRTNLEHKRGKWEKDSILLDRSAEEYFRVAGITNSVERNAANRLIQTLKRLQIWDRLLRCYLFSPTSSAAAAICAKTLTTATLVNSPAHSSAGLSFVASSSQRMDTGLPWSTNSFSFPSMHMAASLNSITTVSNQCFMGINGASTGGYTALLIQAGTGTRRIRWQGATGGTLNVTVQTTPASSLTCLAQIRDIRNVRGIRDTGAVVSSSSGTDLLSWGTTSHNFPIGCGVSDITGSFTDYCTATFGFVALGLKLSDSNNDQLTRYWRAIRDYGLRLGR